MQRASGIRQVLAVGVFVAALHYDFSVETGETRAAAIAFTARLLLAMLAELVEAACVECPPKHRAVSATDVLGHAAVSAECQQHRGTIG